jgi:hypothetical protein
LTEEEDKTEAAVKEETEESLKGEDYNESPVKAEDEDESPKKDDDSAKDHGEGDEDVTMTFPQRLMDILNNDEEHGDTISWLPHGRGFMIYKKKLFETKIMPKYFHKNSKYTSFTRKLNRWGFVRVTRGPEMGAYYHKFFKRGESRLCMQMSCQRPNGMGMESGFPGGEMPPAMYAQMALQQQQQNPAGGGAGGYPTNMAGGQNYLQMQQQHMQLLMRHREQMMQREALMNRQMGGQQGQQQQQQQMSAMQMQQMGQMGMNKGGATGSPGNPGQPGMMGMQQGREMGRAGGYPNNM